MTTPLPAGFTTRDIPAVHAAIAPSSAIQRERRALYQLAADLLEPGGLQALDSDVIDSPLARHRIGEALTGRVPLGRSKLVGIKALCSANSGGKDLRVASRLEASTLLAGALDAVGAELRRHQTVLRSPGLLTEADSEHFSSALSVLRDGLTFARSVNLELFEDLLVHVALVGIIDPQCTGRLVSASPRAFPGLVLLRGPQSSIEVAEALVHEGAHQKLFDLAITHDMLNTDSDRCPPFHPPWTPEDRLWPLEQTLAACHAYACLARFGHETGVTAKSRALGANSLLPVASERSKILGQWLLDKGDYLGGDAHTLLHGLIGRRPRATRTTEGCTGAVAPLVATDYVVDIRLEFRRCGSRDRVLVGRPSQPPQLYWVSDDAAALLEVLGQRSLDEVIHTFAQRWRVPQLDATNRLTALLSDLFVAGLVTTKR